MKEKTKCKKRKWLKKIRLKLKLTQKEVADLVFMSRAEYNNIENGKVNPHPLNALRISVQLDFPSLNFYKKDL